MKKILFLVLALTLWLQAVPVETFKSRNPARFDGYGITMYAKINDLNCNYTIGYGTHARTVCRVIGYHKYKGHRDAMIILHFDPSYQNILNQYMNSGKYGFISCTYAYKPKRLQECTIR